ncbi:hypothetical protein WJX72_003695 [[Myrmecia] bisecta]|uniref:Photolyase/cryptochrome alpha/beta domain-containing protein n=1 Tax=[Myrmecia] bisecta TaxID=41462 RepID=A0AAW1PFV6_9CHLO
MPTPGAGSLKQLAIVWFRNDLRLTDHLPLSEACKQSGPVVPFFCIDPTCFQPRRPDGSGLPKLGPHKCRALLQALGSLRGSLKAKGADLVLKIGCPGAQISLLLDQVGDSYEQINIYHYLQLGPDSLAAEAAVAAACQTATCRGLTCRLHRYWGATLYHPGDLPYDRFPVPKDASCYTAEAAPAAGNAADPRSQARLRRIPPVMTDFRKALEAHASVRCSVPAPDHIPPLPQLSCCGNIPTDVRQLYEQVGASAALQALEQLTGASVEQLLAQSAEQLDHLDPPPAQYGEAPDPLKHLPAVQHDYSKPAPDPADMVSSLQDAGGEQLGQQRPECRSDQGPIASTLGIAEAPAWVCGEEAGLQRLRWYLFGDRNGPSGIRKPAPLDGFKDSRMLAYGVDNSTKLSVYLALGCLSPRMVHELAQQHIQLYSGADGDASSAIWLKMHLLIRDFFIFTAMKEADKLLRPEGITSSSVEWDPDEGNAKYQRWCRGQTGLPFIDACMRELMHTGYMSNRGRQNTASFLTKELRIDWRLGADYFESLLIDHDFGVNHVNWLYFSGLGNDPRNRSFKSVTQGLMYDEAAQLIKQWLPELRGLPAELAHQPWDLPTAKVAELRYPEPMVQPESQISVKVLEKMRKKSGAS